MKDGGHEYDEEGGGVYTALFDARVYSEASDLSPLACTNAVMSS